jgi:hypothetical protein
MGHQRHIEADRRCRDPTIRLMDPLSEWMTLPHAGDPEVGVCLREISIGPHNDRSPNKVGQTARARVSPSDMKRTESKLRYGGERHADPLARQERIVEASERASPPENVGTEDARVDHDRAPMA